jgi:uncharacterized membrane protein
MNAAGVDHNLWEALWPFTRCCTLIRMKQTPRFLTLFLLVASAGMMACAKAPTANTNQPSVNANTAQSNSSQTKPAPQPDNKTTGSIEITSVPPGARVLLIATGEDTAGEPQSKGVTPTTITGVKPGKYTVDLEKQGYKFYQKEITVKKGSTAKIAATLKKR